MEQVFIISVAITIFYFLLKVIEMKYLEKEVKPFKTIICDSCIVFISCMATTFVYFYFNKNIHDFFNIITDTATLNTASNTQVFTDEPGF
jgi:hypothetical protein